MPIHVPGYRSRRTRLTTFSGKRRVIASLSLTAMVDMFTVLVIFLLQNYNSTGEVLYLPKEVRLPQASAVKELAPAHVVIITSENIYLDKDIVGQYAVVKGQEDWIVPGLYNRLKEVLRQDAQNVKMGDRFKEMVNSVKPHVSKSDERTSRITVQADKEIDMLTVKKIMNTLAEAGASEINFAVIKKPHLASAN